jgi:ketosteroid isomerase-like protein
VGGPRAGEGFLASFGKRDRTRLDEFYSADAVLCTPLTGPLRGRDAIWDYFSELHRAFPGLRVTLHDEFYSADGTRACWRIRLHCHNTASFYGNPPTGETGVMTETHVVRLAGGRITEHVIGDNSFHMPHQELVAWRMPYAEATPDPAPAIASVAAPVQSAP